MYMKKRFLKTYNIANTNLIILAQVNINNNEYFQIK